MRKNFLTRRGLYAINAKILNWIKIGRRVKMTENDIMAEIHAKKHISKTQKSLIDFNGGDRTW